MACIESIGRFAKTKGTYMKTALSHLYLAILILLSILQLKMAQASELEIQTFRIHVQNFQIADQQYQAAPGGSSQEQMANLQRNEAAQAAKNIIRAPNTFVGLMASENEQLLAEFSQEYQAAAGGSIRESIFDVARRAAGDGLQLNAVLEIQSVLDYKQALQLTLTAEQKYQNAAGGSLLESIFNSVRSQGFVISKQKLQDYVQNQLQDFRQGESLFVYLDNQYQAAAGGSLIENYYQVGRQTVQGRTIELMRLNAPYMSLQQLAMIRDEYNAKYQAASGGSLAEAMYRAIRDEAQMRLQSIPPAPSPGNPSCVIHEGRNAAGQILFRVMTTSGAIIATVLDSHEAAQIAMSDARCR
jgi:hypothetical protein